MTKGYLVDWVEPDSIAEELNINPGDRILAINGSKPADILDWRLAESSEEIVLMVEHRDGELVEYEIEKDYDEALGMVFDSPVLDEIRRCQNRCVFCFVDQMPPEMRSTLYVKDDDYRLSFLSGSYITLTNLRESDLERIEKLHLSPLYVSVHTTDANLRQRMMNHKRAGEILPILKRLAQAGVSFHTQIVLCPNLNDGEYLNQTITDLFGLYPAVQSLAVVPVGLTGHRDGLYPLSPFDQSHTRAVLAQLATWQERCLAEQGTRFVFASDEFYNMAGADIPPDEVYEDYPQLENGVGLLRLMYNDWERWQERLPAEIADLKKVTVITGASASRYLQPIMDRLSQINGLSIRLETVKNYFFGGHVTVAGLLTYHDLLPALKKAPPADLVILPDVMLKEGKELFLDGHTISDLSHAIDTPIRAADSLDALLTDLLESK
jgi:putative radical SAM enzyme (TIGR03279 family)